MLMQWRTLNTWREKYVELFTDICMDASINTCIHRKQNYMERWRYEHMYTWMYAYLDIGANAYFTWKDVFICICKYG